MSFARLTCPFDRLGVHDVEAVASIHQYLGELLHANDRVDQEQVPA